MSSPAVGGDLVLTARPLAAEAFAPFGQVLEAGRRVRLGGRTDGGVAAVLVALDVRETAPRRVVTLQRYPQARRMVVAAGGGAFLLVVAGKGERPVGPPVAFLVVGPGGVALDAGVWHAGPVPLEDAAVLEATEALGSADRLDRIAVADAFGAEGLRLMTVDEVGAPGGGLDLAEEFAVTIAEAARGRVALGCLAFDALSVGEGDDVLFEESERLAHALREQHGPDVVPSRIPGLVPVREMFRALGVDPTKTRPSSEALLRRVLQGRSLPRVNALVDAMNLCSLSSLVPFGVYDRARLSAPVVLRPGVPGEAYEGIGHGRVGVEGRLTLADRDGPFGTPSADSARTAVGHGTTRALVVAYLPHGVEDPAALRLLDDVSANVLRSCGGRETGRRLVR